MNFCKCDLHQDKRASKRRFGVKMASGMGCAGSIALPARPALIYCVLLMSGGCREAFHHVGRDPTNRKDWLRPRPRIEFECLVGVRRVGGLG